MKLHRYYPLYFAIKRRLSDEEALSVVDVAGKGIPHRGDDVLAVWIVLSGRK